MKSLKIITDEKFDMMWANICPLVELGTMTALVNHVYNACCDDAGDSKSLIQTMMWEERTERK